MMPSLEITRCSLLIETVPPLRQYGWVARGVTPCYSLPFHTPAERSRFLRLLAAYVGPTAALGAVEDLAALLCLYHGDDEAVAQAAAHYLDADYADLLTVTPLEEIDEMVGLLLEEAAAVEGAR